MRKKEVITVNVSSSFASRARCKKCGKSPSIYFFSRNPVLWYDPNRARNVFDFIKKYCKRLATEDYKLDNFIYANRSGYYNHPVNYKGFKPKLHKNRGVDPVFNFVEYLTCNCGYTFWAFSEISSIRRPEISHRKAKYNTDNLK